MTRLSDSGGQRPFRPREHTERGGRGADAARGASGVRGRGPETKPKAQRSPRPHPGRACFAEQGTRVKDGPTAPPREVREGRAARSRAAAWTSVRRQDPRPARALQARPARQGRRPTEHGGATRGHSPVTCRKRSPSVSSAGRADSCSPSPSMAATTLPGAAASARAFAPRGAPTSTCAPERCLGGRARTPPDLREGGAGGAGRTRGGASRGGVSRDRFKGTKGGAR